MTIKKIKYLIFIENAEQVEVFSNYFCKENFYDNYKIIAIGPSAQAALIKLDIKFDKSDHYFSNNDHIHVLKKADEIINHMRDGFALNDNLRVKHAYEREFFAIFRYYFLNYCLSILTIINNACRKNRPEKIYFPSSTSPKLINKAYLSDSSLLGYLGRIYSLSHDVAIVLEGRSKMKDTSSGKDFLSYYLSKFNSYIFSIQLIIYWIYSRNKNVIFTSNKSYNVPRVIDSLSRKFRKPFIVGGSKSKGVKLLLSVLIGKEGHFFNFPPYPPSRHLKEFIKSLDKEIYKIQIKIDKNPQIYSIHNICLNKLMMEHIQNGLKNKVIETFSGSAAFNKIINIKKPAFIFSNQASGYHYAIGEQSAMNNINAMLASHGTHVLHDQKWAKNEWDEHARFMIKTHYPFVAVQTPWTKNFLYNHTESKKIVTGPLLYSKSYSSHDISNLKKLFQKHSDKKIILHAASPFAWYVFHPYVNMTHDEYIKHINDVIKSVEKLDNAFLAIRIRLKSFHGMSKEDIESLLYKSDCYEVYTDRSFEEYLACSDLLVSFSSTTIEESLQVKVPVLQYDPFNRYEHISSQQLSDKSKSNVSPIYYISEFNNLSSGLHWIKNNHLDKEHSKDLIDWSPHILILLMIGLIK